MTRHLIRRLRPALLLSACMLVAPFAADAQDIAVWITTADHSTALAPAAPARFTADDGAGKSRIAIDGTRQFQEIVGFGASLTDSSAWLIQHKLDAQQRDALLRELFGRDDGGLGLSFSRLTIGASDFSRHHYSLADTPDGTPDPELKHFSIDENRGDVIPVARAMLAVNPQLKIMASPWSAPGWMKDTNSLIQGTLLPQYYDAFSRYLLKYVDAYAAEGIPIFALTVQNEPDYEPKDYPGMRLNAPARARLIGDHLGPMIAIRGSGPLIFDWDHNWDKPQEPLGVLGDAKANPHVAAVAWHCYGGEVAAQSPVHDAFPDKDAYMTECSGGDWEPVRSGGLPLQMKNIIIRSARHWARGALFWNLALDENNGPYAGGCDTCRGVVTIDSRTGAITRTDEYYALAHASRFVRQGAHRIASSETGDDLDNVAFRNADDGSLVLLVANSAKQPRRFSAVQGGKAFGYTLPARSVATFVWKPAAAQHD
ncbi:glycoside hydrolase family 30 beta sandwich domain-containing protein [Pseudoxanthomonas sp. PXM01]|uniref:glycoside hydrolase family 30 protein n=1 Tax=Pseudoxanthomonas sp. PXM01 TaxID=2769295 RepID=UPI00177C7818|nr:glycoside hydrolase family 30 beta sandwich domain-containing protein [Pseudoxanthomonas sp. PXM01]MBD9468549.1 glycosyl hydrolase [Pseudoxanthomonas sp. PXM01]